MAVDNPIRLWIHGHVIHTADGPAATERVLNSYFRPASQSPMLVEMNDHAVADWGAVSGSGHPRPVQEAHERMLSDGRASSRFVRLPSGARVHLIEVGEGVPLILLHGTTTSSLSHLPFLAGLSGVRAINLDRPGMGLSDPAPLAPMREAAVAFVDEAANALNLDAFSLAGASMGGTWALWYALARPERVSRLALLGSAPLLPGTRPPAPIRVMVAPLVGDLLSRIPPSERMVVRLMGAMGERETIVDHPALLAALVAAAKDPIAARANLNEFRAITTPFGFKRRMMFTPRELGRVSVPTLLIWGDHDPVGSVDAARGASRLIRDSQLEILPGGHVPWLGNPDRVARLLSAFVGGSASSHRPS